MAHFRSFLPAISVATLLVAIDAAISLGLVSSMVAFLHSYGGGPFEVAQPAGSSLLLAGEPANLVTDQGHATNGAGGTALVLVGLGGLVALLLERRARKEQLAKSSPAFYLWALIVLLSWLLTLAALIYTFVETSLTDGRVIDLAVAEQNSAPARYPVGRWTPENWYAAVLELPLVSGADRRVISGNLILMRAWRWNLIALFVLGFVLLVLVVLELLSVRKRRSKPVSMTEALAGPPK